MIKSEYIELMNREVDGQNSPREHQKLHAYLAGNDDARKYFQDLSRVAEELGKMRPVTPPASLKASIMSAIRTEQLRTQPVRAHRYNPFRAIWDRIIPTPSYAFGFGTVVGALAIVAVVSILQWGKGPDSSSVTGVMIPDLSGTPHVVDQASIDAAQSSLAAVVKRQDDRVSVVLRGTTSPSAVVTIAFDRSDLAFVGVASEPGKLSNLNSTPGTLTLSLADAGNAELAFRDLSPQVSHLTITVNQGTNRAIRELSTGSRANK